MAFTDSQKEAIATVAGGLPMALSMLAGAIDDGAAASTLRRAAALIGDLAVDELAALIGNALDVRVDFGPNVAGLTIDRDLVDAVDEAS